MKSYYLIPLLLLSIVALDSCKKEDLPDNNTDDITEPIDTTGVVDTTDTTTIPTDTTLLPCQGDTSLCNKRYNEMTFVMPHNAHAYTPEFSQLAANQERDISAQLADGVRAFTFKTYKTDDAACGPENVYVYHGFPSLGCLTFTTVLQPIKSFLENNPREIITLGIEGSASIGSMQPVFDQMGLTPYMHDQTFGEAWPTLLEMIASNKRLVVFAARSNANSYAGYHDYWNFIVDNDYQADDLSDFDCEWFRGNPNGDLYLFNHFFTNFTPQRDSAMRINTYPVLKARIDECINFHGRKPNFLHVDFYNLGDCLQIADELNGL